MLRKLDNDPNELALASTLRTQAEELSKLLPNLNQFWGGRIAKLIKTSLAWADQLERRGDG
jgi:hypothetical protein